jgi:hypothetical protein
MEKEVIDAVKSHPIIFRGDREIISHASGK